MMVKKLELHFIKKELIINKKIINKKVVHNYFSEPTLLGGAKRRRKILGFGHAKYRDLLENHQKILFLGQLGG
mgnify:CR=1 FL=1